MFNLLPIFSVAFVAASSASALVIPRASVVTGNWPVPTYYAQGYLEVCRSLGTTLNVIYRVDIEL